MPFPREGLISRAPLASGLQLLQDAPGKDDFRETSHRALRREGHLFWEVTHPSARSVGQALASPWHEKGKWEGVGEAQRLAERRRGEKGGSAAGRAFPWGHAAGQVSRSRLSRGREGAVGEWQVYRADNKGSDCRPGERNPVCSSDPEADFRAPRAFS